MKDKLLYFYVLAIIFFADTYFVLPWLRPVTLLNYLLVFYYIKSPKVKFPIQVVKLKNLFYAFMVFTVLVDFYQNDLSKAVSTLLVYLPIPIVFYLFYSSSENMKLVYFYAKVYLIYNGFFSVLQLIGIHITAGEVLANLAILDVDKGFAENIGNQGLRISGASYSTIGLACNLGVLFCYFYFNETKLYSKKMRQVYLTILVILMIFSQTRSVLLSIIPVIFITHNIINGNKLKVFALSILGLIAVLLVVVLFLPLLEGLFPRLFLGIEEDGSIVHRIQANVYGVVGTFYLSPIIGVPFENALEAMILGYKKVGLFIGYYFIDEVTQHNQPAYFFRYYGLIGFLFFVLIYRKFFTIGLLNYNTNNIKKVVVSIVIFHLFYTFFHNNKFTMDFYLWFFIALNSLNSYTNYTYEQEA